MSADLELLRRAQGLLSARDRRGRPAAIGAALKEGGAPGGGRARLTAWVHGVLRHRRSLHTVLGAVARRATKGRDPRHVAALELGAFRLLFGREPLDAVQAELAPLAQGRKPQEHLRRALAEVAAAVADEVPLAPDPARLEDGDDATLPLSRDRAVRFRRPLLGVSHRNLAGRLGVLHSLPDALVAAWIARHGDATAAELCRAANDPPPLFARVQPLRATREQVIAALAAEGVEARALELEHALRLEAGRGAFRRTGPWRRGELSIQDLTAQRVAPLLDPRPGERLLDLCAAPGTKTAALAERARDQAPLLACDRAPARLRKVEQGAARLGLTSITTRVHDGRHVGALADAGPFDAVLVDAPCSNTGVLRRRPEARWRYDLASQRRLARDQAAILATAAALVRPGGRVVYSVCSIEPEEGEALVRAQPGLRLEREELILPSPGGGDGGYLALLAR
ncbi:MAG: methyltransferase domain-containing protein [Planctomycetes bacterium]|nr:methyltransferase domain-containing protein [Planctomycetota bacterium]